MLIRDWSSDVCSSDLHRLFDKTAPRRLQKPHLSTRELLSQTVPLNEGLMTSAAMVMMVTVKTIQAPTPSRTGRRSPRCNVGRLGSRRYDIVACSTYANITIAEAKFLKSTDNINTELREHSFDKVLRHVPVRGLWLSCTIHTEIGRAHV